MMCVREGGMLSRRHGTHIYDAHPYEGLDHDRPLFCLDGT